MRMWGTLTVGAEADVVVLKHRKGAFSYEDCGYARMDGADRLACKLTVRKGEVVYDRNAMTVPHWEDAPESYWPVTEVPVPIERFLRPLGA